MKKNYIAPAQQIVVLHETTPFLYMSQNGTTSISEEEADGEAFVRTNRTYSSGYNVWDDDWSK